MKIRHFESGLLFMESIFKAFLDLTSTMLPAIISLVILSIYVA